MPADPREIAQLRHWWRSLAPRVPDTVQSLWFSIADMVRDDGRSREFYVVGLGSFDLEDPTHDWASDVIWCVDDRYISVPSLASTLGDPDYRATIALAARLIQKLAPWDQLPRLPGVAVGFDDGDFQIVWQPGCEPP